MSELKKDYQPTKSGGSFIAGKLNSKNVTAIFKGIDEKKFMQFNANLPEGTKAGYYVANMAFLNGGVNYVHVNTAENKNEILLLGVDLVIKGNIFNPMCKPASLAHASTIIKQSEKNASMQVVVKVGSPRENKQGEIVQYCDIVTTATWVKLAKRGAKLQNGKGVELNNMAKDAVKSKATPKSKEASQETA